MGRIGLRIQVKHLCPVEIEKLLRVRYIKAVTEHDLRRIFIALVVKAVHTAEVRNPALRRNPCAAEKDNPPAPVHHFLQLLQLFGFLHINASLYC